ncbi:hypothetical protein CHARACLAT_014305, partial [Characodon lateralis]|nr:hypothetical protein [Characodon lateralis]
ILRKDRDVPFSMESRWDTSKLFWIVCEMSDDFLEASSMTGFPGYRVDFTMRLTVTHRFQQRLWCIV